MYDSNNIFAKILRGEIKSNKIYEDDHLYVFEDINPQAKIHVLVIPKKEYSCYQDFVTKASDEEISNFFKKIAKIAAILNLSNCYRLVTNNGKNAGQEVLHFHVHLLSAK